MATSALKWTTPQLIVLTKGTPEENVLTHCKYIGTDLGPENTAQLGCNSFAENCGNCHSRSGS
jgi:hypothetical protein